MRDKVSAGAIGLLTLTGFALAEAPVPSPSSAPAAADPSAATGPASDAELQRTTLAQAPPRQLQPRVPEVGNCNGSR